MFGFAAIVTIYIAIKLSTYADVLSTKTALGGMLVGTLFLAGATSLPEVTTSLSAIFLGNPDLATGNVLGSNLYNLLILASLDLYFRKQQIFEAAAAEHRFTVYLGIVLSAMILLFMWFDPALTLWGVGVGSYAIFGTYALGMFLLSRRKASAPQPAIEDEQGGVPVPDMPVSRAAIGFVVSAIIILASGTLLSISGDRIALMTGLGSSFVGSFLIAASTSLPEVVTCYVAFKLRNPNLAIGSILGSNLFNLLILTFSDLFYQKGPLLSVVESIHSLTAVFTIVMSLLVLYSLLRKSTTHPLAYSLPSTLMVTLYFVSSLLIFVLR
jgi:cation:H+ antiporter